MDTGIGQNNTKLHHDRGNKDKRTKTGGSKKSIKI